MKVRPFSSMLLSILFYTTVLSAMFVMPLILAGRDDEGVTVETGAPVWTRSPDTQAKAEPEAAWRLPKSDGFPSGPSAIIEAPVDTLGPDKTMIRPVRKRAKTIKL